MAQMVLNTGTSGQTVTLFQESATFDINLVARTELVAPATVWLEIGNQSGFSVSGPTGGAIYDPLEQEAEYFWDFDDAGSTFQPPIIPLNVPDIWKDANHSKGPRATKTFYNPGTYNVTALGVDAQGNYGQKVFQIVVKAEYGNANPADDVFDRIICFASDGDFTNAPSERTDDVTSFAALNALWPDMTNDKVLLLFKRGNTFDEFTIETAAASQNVATMRWGAYGTGAQPILRPPIDESAGIKGSAERTADWQEFVVRDLRILGYWDAVNAVGLDGSIFANDYGAITPGTTLKPGRAIVRCYIDGMTGGGFKGKRTVAADQAVCWSECYVTNWRNNSVFDNRGDNNIGWNYRLSFIGSMFAQSEDAVRTNGINFGNYFAARLAKPTHLDIDACWFFNNIGYSGSQPALRNMSTEPGEGTTYADHHGRYYHHIYRSVFEGGSPPLNFEFAYAGNYIIDTCLFVGTARTVPFIQSKVAFTLRNSLGIEPERTARAVSGGQYFVNERPGTPPPDAIAAAVPVRIYGNTWVVQPSQGVYGTSVQGFLNPTYSSLFDTVIEENNVIDAANLTVPVNVNGPVDTTAVLAGYTPRHKGERDAQGSEYFVTQALSSDVADGATLDFAYPDGTDQAFWLARVGVHDKHTVGFFATTYRQQASQIAVAFEPSVVRVTNTSGATWLSSGPDAELMLDNTGRWPSAVPGQENPSSIPECRPDTGAGAIDGYTSGLLSLTYFDTTIREGSVHPSAATGTQDLGAQRA